jgi:chromatin structure-remodeling complex subunit RSC9
VNHVEISPATPFLSGFVHRAQTRPRLFLSSLGAFNWLIVHPTPTSCCDSEKAQHACSGRIYFDPLRPGQLRVCDQANPLRYALNGKYRLSRPIQPREAYVMAPNPAEMVVHTIERTPEYEKFMSDLREYHIKRGTTLDPEPKVGTIHLDLFKVFNHIVANGGYDKVSEEKLAWRRMASELGIFSNNEASTAFALKEKFYKNLAAYEISTVHGKEPPPKDILEDVTAKGASLLTRTRENFRGKRESNIGAADSAASGDDGTPARERPTVDAASASARASRGLREAPPQRVIFQPDTGPTRATRQAAIQQNANQATPVNQTPTPNVAQPTQHHPNMQAMQQHQQHQQHHQALPHHSSRGPSVVHQPPTSENISYMISQYQPKQSKPLQLRAVATPSSAPTEFQRSRISQRNDPANRPPMQPGGKHANFRHRC